MLVQEEHHVIVKAETRGMQQKSRNTKDGTQKPRCLELALCLQGSMGLLTPLSLG